MQLPAFRNLVPLIFIVYHIMKLIEEFNIFIFAGTSNKEILS